jgi:hypothetical protein
MNNSNYGAAWTAKDEEAVNIQMADARFDVLVCRVTIQDSEVGGQLVIDYQVADRNFRSTVTYGGVSNWHRLVQRMGWENWQRFLASYVAFDGMKLLTLGGTTILMPKELALTREMQDEWKYCFLNTYGEWRFRNSISYAGDGPQIKTNLNTPVDFTSKPGKVLEDVRCEDAFTIGGGKDTVAGHKILSELQIKPLFVTCYSASDTRKGLDEARARNSNLFQQLRPDALVTEIWAEDTLSGIDDAELIDWGVKVKYVHTDFSIGVLANYIGYLPVIAQFGLKRVWMNMEDSSDLKQIDWDGKPISHQWVKSSEFRALSKNMIRRWFEDSNFEGFPSPIAGLSDVAIYCIALGDQKAIKASYSCNYKKPWCRACLKCLFCYLSMTALVSEDFAMETMGIAPAAESLLMREDLVPLWVSLINPNYVPWECVPQAEACRLLASILPPSKVHPEIQKQLLPLEEAYQKILHNHLNVTFAKSHELSRIQKTLLSKAKQALRRCD